MTRSHRQHDSGSRVDLCITTMDRPQALERLLLSIARYRPEARVNVADQSRSFDSKRYDRLAKRLAQAGLHERPTVHRLPFDCGVSVARNFLVDATPGKYKLSLDDDFVFTEETDIDALVRLIEAHPEAGMAGGAVSRNGRARRGGTRLVQREASVVEVPCERPFEETSGIRFKRLNYLPLFVLMREELFEHLRWDPEQKTGGGQHLDFFLCLRDVPYTALFAPDVMIDHPPAPDTDSSYRKRRTRPEFLEKTLSKHGLRRVEYIGGAIFELRPGGGLIGYCELHRGARSRRRPVST